MDAWDELARLGEARGAELGISGYLHPDDFLIQFFLDHFGRDGEGRKKAVDAYFETGAQSAALLSQVIERSEAKLPGRSLLEFASGYGMVTRHLVKDNWAVTSCDIHQQAIDMLRDEIGVQAVLSRREPEELEIGRFDVVFALSFFSHMPLRTWERWLLRLYRSVVPGGLLIFTTHGRASQKAQLQMMLPVDGFAFMPQSEQKDLAPEDYGATLTLPSFVARAVERNLSTAISYFKEAYWFGHQDVYVVKAG